MTGSDDFITGVDIFIIILYFTLIFFVGIGASFRCSRNTVKGYFLAGQRMAWWPIGASMIASNIGSAHFIGLSGMGAADGIAVVIFELFAVFVLCLLGWFFVPVYLSAKVYSMPEYLKKRFGSQRIRVYIACLFFMISITTKISVEMYAGALFIQQALGWNLYLATVMLLIITALYTIAGGLAAVMYTDAVQMVFIILGGFAMMFMAFDRVPLSELQLRYAVAIPQTTLDNPNTSCGYPRSDAFHLFRSVHTGDVPWPGAVFGVLVSSIWYWCADQVIVQRALASRSLLHARGGCIFTGFFKLLPLLLFVFPGMVSRVLFPDEVACATPESCERVCSASSGCSNVAYPKLVVRLMPAGLRGFMLAVIMSALMSSITSIFNSCSTVFVIDIWRRIRPNVTETELMVVGRIFIYIMVGMSVLWIPIIEAYQDGLLFDYIQSITSYLSPPLSAVYILGVAWPRINEKGAFWGLVIGLVLGIIGLSAMTAFPPPKCDEPDTRPDFVQNWHYLYFGICSFVIVSICVTVISLLTAKIDKSKLVGLTWSTRMYETERVSSLHAKTSSPSKKPNIKAPTNSSILKSFINWFCGIKSKPRWRFDRDKEDIMEASTFRDQHSKKQWRVCLHVATVIMVGCSVFLIGYYG